MPHSKPGTRTRGSALLSIYSLYTGWHAAPEQAQLVSGKTMRQVVQRTAKILRSYDKEKTFLLIFTYLSLILHFSCKLKNLQQLHFDVKTYNLHPRLFSSRDIVAATQTSLFAQSKHHQQNASPATIPNCPAATTVYVLSLAIGAQINTSQGTGGIYFVAVRTCLSHEGDNLPRFTPTMGYSNHSMDFRISHVWGTIFFSCFEISEVRALKINCLWGQLWKIWTQSMLSHVVAQQKAIGRPLIPFGSIIRKVLGWGKWTLNFAMHFKALLNIRMENLVLASPMAYVMDKIFYFFVSSKHKGCFVGGCCVLRFPVSPWRAGWRGRIRHFPFLQELCVHILGIVWSDINDFLLTYIFLVSNQWTKPTIIWLSQQATKFF